MTSCRSHSLMTGWGADGAGNHDIRKDEVTVHLVKFHRPAPDLLGKDYRPFVRPVGYIYGGQVFCRECLGDKEPHFTAPDDEDMPPPEAPDLLLRELDRGRPDRDCTTVDLGPFPAFDADMDGLVDTEFEHACRIVPASCASVMLSSAGRLSGLHRQSSSRSRRRLRGGGGERRCLHTGQNCPPPFSARNSARAWPSPWTNTSTRLQVWRRMAPLNLSFVSRGTQCPHPKTGRLFDGGNVGRMMIDSRYRERRETRSRRSVPSVVRFTHGGTSFLRFSSGPPPGETVTACQTSRSLITSRRRSLLFDWSGSVFFSVSRSLPWSSIIPSSPGSVALICSLNTVISQGSRLPC